MRDGSQSELIFPSVGDEPFSDMAMLAVLDRLGYGHVTVHGFRATFANAPIIQTAFARDCIMGPKKRKDTDSGKRCAARCVRYPRHAS
jgi:hypothetical protein